MPRERARHHRSVRPAWPVGRSARHASLLLVTYVPAISLWLPGLVGAAPIFAALGKQTRLTLVARLCRSGPMSITSLTAGAGVTRQAISKHLRVLAGVGLARGGRVGRDHV